MLKVSDLSVRYGAIEAVKSVTFDVNPGEIVAIIGANGAGKTSVLRALSRIAPSSGQLIYRGRSIVKVPPHRLVSLGISHVPEGRGVFLNLTVEENLDLGAYSRSDRAEVAQDLERVFELFPRLKERRTQSAGTLSGGEQQMLAIGRALLSRPDLLLLDEPSLGLAPQIIERIFEIIQMINREGKTILLVEQNALQALEIAHRGIVLETGRLVRCEEARRLLDSDEIRRAYLGVA